MQASAGVESAIHAMRGFLDDDQSDGILLIDADNAFNRINRVHLSSNEAYFDQFLSLTDANIYEW